MTISERTVVIAMVAIAALGAGGERRRQADAPAGGWADALTDRT